MYTLNDEILQKTIRIRPEQSFKGTYGKVTLIGGNANFGGAIIMASTAAVYSGAGLVTTLSDMVNLSSLHANLPEAMIANYKDKNNIKQLVNNSNVVVIGPGLGTDDNSLNILKTTFKNITPDQTLIIDGSAITLVAEKGLSLPKANLAFTPHQMEWQRLSGIPIKEQNDYERNQKVQQELNATIVLKSHHTHIYTNNGIYVNPCGTPAQATGGMGDTLAGMISGFTAQFKNQDNAILAAVYSHSAIADKLAQNQYVVLPHQIIEHLPQFMYQHQADR